METPKFSSDPRLDDTKYSKVKNWEEGIEDESSADAMLYMLKSGLKENGIDLNQHSKILEVGSGLGIFTEYLRKNGYNAVGVDARPRGAVRDGIVAARIEQLPFQNNTFDIVLANGVFDTNVYEQDQTLMVQELGRILRVDGVYVSTGPWDPKNGYENYFEMLSSNRLISVYKKK